MPEIEIRPAEEADIPALIALDHNYSSDYVWQMELQQEEEGHVAVSFRQTRLPRAVRVEYPRPARRLAVDWGQRHGLLVACLKSEPIGYASVMLNIAPRTAWVTDLVVHRRLRRQGIATALLLAAAEWGAHHKTDHLVMEMQPRNYPAISLARKLGFEFAGYNDRYYANQDIGLFFAKTLL